MHSNYKSHILHAHLIRFPAEENLLKETEIELEDGDKVESEKEVQVFRIYQHN